MLPVDTYDRRASECLKFAETSPSFDDRTTWRELALCWLRLSDHAERFRHEKRHEKTWLDKKTWLEAAG
jgi:hypothetical protein